jgi:hypothetical protein
MGAASAVDRPPDAHGVDRFSQVGRVDLTAETSSDMVDQSGWLILDSANRRGYTLTRLPSNKTEIASFDLDTLRPLARTNVSGLPILGGDAGAKEGTDFNAGDVLHAVDSVTKRVYIPMGGTTASGIEGNNDRHRALTHVLVLDEARFDADPNAAFGAFYLPASEQNLAAHALMGLTTTRVSVEAGKAARVLAIFAAPTPDTTGFGAPGPRNHMLVSWDVSTVHADQKAPDQPSGALPIPAAAPLPVGDWEEPLTSCGTAPMTSTGAGGVNPSGAKNYQWEFLPTKDAVYLACNSAPNSGAVVRVALTEAGRPAPAPNQQVVALGKPIGNVLADRTGNRLYLSVFGSGATWWAFDTATMRFAGSMAATLVEGTAMGAGLDPGTGRFYTLTPDYCADRTGGGMVAVRGGVKIADARLDPVPAPENVRPDLAYSSHWRIAVDSVTRRVYVRLGAYDAKLQYVYPNCGDGSRQAAPVESFWRVFEDRTPVASVPPKIDDALLTTNVPESKGFTQASYLGSGGSFGARLLLTGGLDAVSQGAVSIAKSPCGRDDRELLVGSVSGVDVSDQSVSAGAASLDADGRTQAALGDPLSRCRPPVAPPSPVPTVEVPGFDVNQCHGDTEELAFDEQQLDSNHHTVDKNPEDGCPDRTGVNRYETRCLEDAEQIANGGPPKKAVPRDGFAAHVKCEAAKETALGTAEGAISSALVDGIQGTLPKPIGDEKAPLRIGHASSAVTVKRELGNGVTVTVEALARGIDLPGIGTIGAVRAEATSTATGRDGRAHSVFTRTICDVHLDDIVVSGCLGDERQQDSFVSRFNSSFAGRAEMRLRRPDKPLFNGSPHGYLTAVQRDQKELFGDQAITRDKSLALPALEITLFQGDGGTWGAGRQVLQLAGVQASTSYGIVCTYGQAANGQCARGEGDSVGTLDDGGSGVPGIDSDTGGPIGGDSSSISSPSHRDPLIVRVLKNIPRALAQAMQLLFNNPRELGLMAAVWGLIYAPCYLGERRRSVGSLRGRRSAALGGVR